MTEEIIKAIEDFLNVDIKSLSKDADILHNGIVDSFGFVQLLLYLEEKFNIDFSQEELESKEIKTINGLIRKIIEKMSANEEL